MKKTTAVVSAIALSLGLLVSGGAAQAADSQEASLVGAYYRVDLGYKVTWQTPANTSGITGYVVTANPTGQTCTVRGKTAYNCTFTTRQLGYTNQYTFTVATMKDSSVLATSEASNAVSAASIPVAPTGLVSEVVSSTQIDVAWIPNANTGGAPLYGYKLTYWQSDRYGQPIGSTKVESVLGETYASLEVESGYMYIINVASCNAYGCNSADYWSYANTGATNVTLPRIISGGSASTTCFESIYDANVGEAELGSCGSIVVDPSTYPVINPSATTLNQQLAVKLPQAASLTFSSKYSLKTWGPIGISWFAYFNATSKSITLGWDGAPVIYSTTPSVCEIVDNKLQLKSVGTCKVEAYVNESGVFKQSNIARDTITVTN